MNETAYRRHDLARFLFIAVVVDAILPLLGFVVATASGIGLVSLFIPVGFSVVWLLEILSKQGVSLSKRSCSRGWRFYPADELPLLSTFLKNQCDRSSHLTMPNIVGFSGELNLYAGVRFSRGPLGLAARVLLVGKPSLDFLTTDEIECVFSHELAHSPSVFMARLYSWAYDRSSIPIIATISKLVFPLRDGVYRLVNHLQMAGAKSRDEDHSDSVAKKLVGDEPFATAVFKMQALSWIHFHELPKKLMEKVVETPDVLVDYIEFTRDAISNSEFPANAIEEMTLPRKNGLLDSCATIGQKLERLDFGRNMLQSDSDDIDKQLNDDFQVHATDSWREWHFYLTDQRASNLCEQHELVDAIRERLLW